MIAHRRQYDLSNYKAKNSTIEFTYPQKSNSNGSARLFRLKKNYFFGLPSEILLKWQEPRDKTKHYLTCLISMNDPRPSTVSADNRSLAFQSLTGEIKWIKVPRTIAILDAIKNPKFLTNPPKESPNQQIETPLFKTKKKKPVHRQSKNSPILFHFTESGPASLAICINILAPEYKLSSTYCIYRYVRVPVSRADVFGLVDQGCVPVLDFMGELEHELLLWK